MARKLAVVVGAPRQGKTYYSERAAIQYAKSGGCAIAYNVGMNTDFADFIEITPITPKMIQEMRYLKDGKKLKEYELPRSIDYFIHNDSKKKFHFKDFNSIFRGKCVKIRRLNPGLEERLFYDCIYEYLYDCLLVLDDIRASTRHGLNAELIQFLSRSNHTGREYVNGGTPGVDIIMIYHEFRTVVQEIYGYANCVVQFITSAPARLKFYPELDSILTDSYDWLRTAPKFSRVEIDTILLTSKRIKNV